MGSIAKPPVEQSDEEKIIGIDTIQAGRCKLNNCISLPKAPVILDEEKIFKAANDYQNWVHERYTIKDLPAFDSSTSFGITVDEENSNIREEIKKLVQFINSKKPPLFDSYGALGGTNAAGFEDLFNVVDQISCNIHIIRHDNACLALDHYIHEFFYDTFEQSRRIVRTRYIGKPLGITGHNPTILSDESKNTQAYHALIDFLFQSLAWWLVRVAESKLWHAPIIAILARWSVKLKLIALDPVRWAEQSIIRGENIILRISNDQNDEDRISIELPSDDREIEPKKIYFPNDKDPDYCYYIWKLHIRESLYKLVRRILNNLIDEEFNIRRSTAFELRTLIYSGDLDKMLRQLTVQRDGTVETSSDLTDLRQNYCAFQLLLSNAQSIPQTGANASSLEIAKLHWHIKKIKTSDPDVGSVTTARLDDVVSTLVPLGLMGSSDLVETLDIPELRRDPDDDYHPADLELSPEESPRIEFSLSTGQRKNDTLHRARSTMVPTSRSPLIASMEDVAKELENCEASNMNSEGRLKSNALEIFREYETRKAEIKDWAITEDSVRVRTKKYSGIVLTIAIIIIGGSLPVPFLVKNRIPGVDPFQFITFSWLLAGAFLVGAKSRYVENWPWHDFLRGQILCRSVSELAVASRVNKQTVLLYLLHHEFRNPLVFRGPYHGVFRRRAELGTEGFSIDVPVGHATVLAAGFIVLRVRYTREKDTMEKDTIEKDTREKETKEYTLLHDTRDDALDYGDEQIRSFGPLEGFLNNKGEKQKLGFKERGSLRPDEDQPKVLGIPTADCDFV